MKRLHWNDQYFGDKWSGRLVPIRTYRLFRVKIIISTNFFIACEMVFNSCFSSYTWFSTRLKLYRVWQFIVVCRKLCVRTEILFWCKYAIWQLLKNILEVVNNDVHVRKWLGKPRKMHFNLQMSKLKSLLKDPLLKPAKILLYQLGNK